MMVAHAPSRRRGLGLTPELAERAGGQWSFYAKNAVLVKRIRRKKSSLGVPACPLALPRIGTVSASYEDSIAVSFHMRGWFLTRRYNLVMEESEVLSAKR